MLLSSKTPLKLISREREGLNLKVTAKTRSATRKRIDRNAQNSKAKFHYGNKNLESGKKEK
ncbi:MAG: hypothetical protein ABH863_03600 [Candidatus Micrarchaeota archaeon]